VSGRWRRNGHQRASERQPSDSRGKRSDGRFAARNTHETLIRYSRTPRHARSGTRDDLIPTDQLKIGGSDFEVRETKDGLGVPVVAKCEADQVHDLAPTPHFFYAVAIIARFEGSRCVLAIKGPMKSATVRVGWCMPSLAADYTAPPAMMLVELHPEKLDPQPQKKMLVIGHSMGSCISRLLTSNSGDRIWREMFTVPPEQMDIADTRRDILPESSICPLLLR
jgi:hypothetical protein